MARRWKGNMNGEEYLANRNIRSREVHDLDNEKASCRIDEIIRSGNDKPYTSHASARADGYDNCHYCLGNSTR